MARCADRSETHDVLQCPSATRRIEPARGIDAAEGIVVSNSLFVDTFSHKAAWLLSAAFNIRTQPGSIPSFIKLARCEGENHLSDILLASEEIETIQLQKHHACQKARPFISVH